MESSASPDHDMAHVGEDSLGPLEETSQPKRNPNKGQRVSLVTGERSSVATIDEPMMNNILLNHLMANRVNRGLSAVPPVRQSRAATQVEATGKKADVEAGALDAEELVLLASHADPSLIMSMERTLFSAFNQAIILTISGVGFMSVGDQPGPKAFGAFILIAGLCYAMISYFFHCWRLHRLNSGRGLAPYDSQIWTGMLALLIFLALAFEVYYGFRYPFLDRAKAVEIANAGGST